MEPIAYSRGRKLYRVAGTTSPSRTDVNAILKSDTTEIPSCVYNELVASRLAVLLDMPIATGVLVGKSDKYEYASLIPEVDEQSTLVVTAARIARAIELYPHECAAILAFDGFIGNWDRGSNVKADLTARTRRFFGFDHSHCLLAIESTPEASICKLCGATAPPFIAHHPFASLLKQPQLLNEPLKRILALRDTDILRAANFGMQINDVQESTQSLVGHALRSRRFLLNSFFRNWSSRLGYARTGRASYCADGPCFTQATTF